MMERNLHCRALVLGGCHDNGYATFLESFRTSKKVGLLESTPPAADFRKLRFQRFSFPHIFRSDPLPARHIFPPPGFGPPSSFGTTALSPTHHALPPHPAHPSHPFPPTAAASVTSSSKPTTPIVAAAKPATPVSVESKRENEPRASSWAAVGGAGAPRVIDISVRKNSAAKERNFYLLNKRNERVDMPLPKIDPAARESFDDKMKKNGANFCNRYHLLGSCKQYDVTGRCPYIHGERLVGAEQATLRARARGLPCNSGSQCTDPWCTSGHHCPNANSCWFDENCRFSETHGMDLVRFLGPPS